MSKRKGKIMRLTKIQSTGLGLDYHSEILNETIWSLFPKVNKEFMIEGNKLQSFEYFTKKISNDSKDERTSRYQLLKHRNKLGLIGLGNVAMNTKKMNQIKKFMEAYFCLDVVILPSLDLKYIDNLIYIVDSLKKLSFPLKLMEKSKVFKSQNETGAKNINVLSIFKVLAKYLSETIYNIVAIIDHPIADPVNPDDIIAGRACEDRVCVILDDCDTQQFLATIAHECMHTMGIGHCVAWNCIMNAGMSNFMQLCPMDLRKLYHLIGFDILTRYRKIDGVLRKLDLKDDAKWTKKIIGLMDQEEKRLEEMEKPKKKKLKKN